MRWLFPLIMILVLSSLVLGEEMTAYIDQPTTISTACIRNYQMRENVNVSVVVYDSNGTVVVPKTPMQPSGNGTFSFTYTFTNVGGYATRETCDFGDYLADGSTLITVLKPTFGNMQVLAQGVKEADLNTTIKSEWLLLLPNSTNTSQSSIKALNGSCAVFEMNGTQLFPDITTSVVDDTMIAVFQADSSYGFAEANNYQLTCNIELTQGMHVNGVKNFFYITPHKSFLQFWQSVFVSLGQILGVVQETQATLNQTLDISNQTLQIVSGLNITGVSGNVSTYEFTPNLMVFESKTWENTQVTIGSMLRSGSAKIFDASCNINIINQMDNTYVINQGSVVNAGLGSYIYNWTNPNDVGAYTVEMNCSGGGLAEKMVYGSAMVTIMSGAEISILGG
jgi:hypothetical protein